MLETGSVSARSTQNILLKNLMDASMGAIMWWMCGHGVAYDGQNGFIGTAGPSYFTNGPERADHQGYPTESSRTGYDWATWWFQFTFAAASTTIVSGAVAERTHLLSYIVYTMAITLLVYPVVVHWVWSDYGWISPTNPNAVLHGVIDFAGSGVVHMTGGFSSLFAAAIVGPRVGRFDRGSRKGRIFNLGLGAPCPMPGHSTVLQALGTFILWMGW